MSQVSTGYERARDSVGNEVLTFRENRSSSSWKGAAFSLLAMFVFLPASCVAGVKTIGGYTFFLVIGVGVLCGFIGKAIRTAKKPAAIKLTRGSIFTSSGEELFFSKITNVEVVNAPNSSAVKANYQGRGIFITHNVDTELAEALYSLIQSWIFNYR